MAGHPRRAALRHRVENNETLYVPYCPDALTARLCEREGFDAGYVSGAALGWTSALTEALLTCTDLAAIVTAVRRRSDLPLVVDCGSGFGDAVHVMRTVWELEAAGADVLEIEDQVAPKQVGHHGGIEHLVAPEAMVAKIEAAAAARRDPDLLIIARTGALQNEDHEAAVARARAYRAAGADVIMVLPRNDDDLVRLAAAVDAPIALLARMDSRDRTAWARSPATLVIDPLTGHAAAFGALEQVYRQLGAGRTRVLDDEQLARYRVTVAELSGLDTLIDVERADAGLRQ